MTANLGRMMICLGLVMIGLGCVFVFGSNIPWMGRLPGDIYIQKKNFSFYFPVTSCVLISTIIGSLYWLFCRR